MKLTPNEYCAMLRSDFDGFIERSFYELNPTTPFQPNWHIEVIAAELEACRRGETKRLIINVPPRSLKSLLRVRRFSSLAPWSRLSAQIIVRKLRSKNWPISYRVIVGLFLRAPSIRIYFQLDCQRSGRPSRSSPLQETVFA